jgi:Bax protein
MRIVITIFIFALAVNSCSAKKAVKIWSGNSGGINSGDDILDYNGSSDDISVLNNNGYQAPRIPIIVDSGIKLAFKPKTVEGTKIQDNNAIKPVFKPLSSVPNMDRQKNIDKILASLSNPSKKRFVSKIGSIVVNENLKISQNRRKLELIFSKYNFGSEISKTDQAFVKNIAESYKIDNFKISSYQNQSELLKRVNIIPESLAIAQAAIESGWGKSRFAKEGNNYFGHWCFQKGCGIIPKNRSSNRTHEVRKFETMEQSVKAYMKNLNTHRAYKEFRSARNKFGGSLEGTQLASYLGKYSEKGQEYSRIVKKVIRQNNFE